MGVDLGKKFNLYYIYVKKMEKIFMVILNIWNNIDSGVVWNI